MYQVRNITDNHELNCLSGMVCLLTFSPGWLGFGFFPVFEITFKKTFNIPVIAASLHFLHSDAGRIENEIHRAGVPA